MFEFENKIIQTARAGVISDAPSLVQVSGNILNFLLSIVGIFAIISLAISGVMYLTSAGSDTQIEKAKKIALYSVVGIITALGAMLIMRQIGIFFK